MSGPRQANHPRATKKMPENKPPTTRHLPVPGGPTPVGMREGVPEGLLASRELKVFGGVEIAHTRYLPGEMEVPPLRGHALNLHLDGTGRLVTRLGGRVWEREQVAGAVEVFVGDRSQERALMGTVSEDVNVLLEEGFARRVLGEAGADPDQVEILDALHARDPQIERILSSLLSEVGNEGLGAELYTRGMANALVVHTCCASTQGLASRWAPWPPPRASRRGARASRPGSSTPVSRWGAPSAWPSWRRSRAPSPGPPRARRPRR